MSVIQDKKSAFWFYRFVSTSYDRLNAPFWNESMRSQALELAKLNRPDLMVLDVGAGTGFTTEGLIKKRQSKNVSRCWIRALINWNSPGRKRL